MENRLKEEAKALLKEGKIDLFIGYGRGSIKFKTTPLITSKEEDLDAVIINPFIVNNLSRYLIELEGKKGVVVKGCDSRSIVSLIQDNKVKRSDLYIFGIPCDGLIDVGKIETKTRKHRNQIDEIVRKDNGISVTIGEEKHNFSPREVLFDKCLVCEYPVPKEVDSLLGESSPISLNKEEGSSVIKRLEEMEPERRWGFWKEQFKNCIRCYACRDICPACFCERCFVEVNRPQWVSPVPDWQDNLLFQITRTLHVAGRCVDCGECERACPARIPLRALQKKMADVMEELYDFKAGMDPESPSFITSYEETDYEDFIR